MSKIDIRDEYTRLMLERSEQYKALVADFVNNEVNGREIDAANLVQEIVLISSKITNYTRSFENEVILEVVQNALDKLSR